MIDSRRDNRKVPVEVWYPAEKAGDNVPVAGPGGNGFPLLCFAHGYLMSCDSYTYLRDALVSEGFIVAFPCSEGEMFPSHIELARDISFIIEKMNEYRSDEHSLFYRKIGGMNCAMGHSLGGGAAVLAASADSAIKSVAVLAPLETRPSAASAASSVHVPVLILAGENDCITRPESHQIPIFMGLQGNSGILLTIKGGSHCQMADRSIICNLPEFFCRPDAAITAGQQHAVILKFLLPWLDFYLKGNMGAGSDFDMLSSSDTCIIREGPSKLTF